MKDTVKNILKKLVCSYDSALTLDQRRLEILLNDYCGSYHKEVNAINVAMRTGIINQMMSASDEEIAGGLIERLGRDLSRDSRIPGDLAIWAVISWAEAMEAAGWRPNLLTPGKAASANLPPVEPPKLQQSAAPLAYEKPGSVPKLQPAQARKEFERKDAPENERDIPAQSFSEDEIKLIEKRKLPRNQLIYYLRVFDRTRRKKIIGHLVDVHKEGIMLISDSVLETNVDYKLRMVLPVGSKSVNVDFDAYSLWCRRDVIPGYYDTGFKLVRVSKEVLDQLGQSVKLYGFKKTAGD